MFKNYLRDSCFFRLRIRGTLVYDRIPVAIVRQSVWPLVRKPPTTTGIRLARQVHVPFFVAVGLCLDIRRSPLRYRVDDPFQRAPSVRSDTGRSHAHPGDAIGSHAGGRLGPTVNAGDRTAKVGVGGRENSTASVPVQTAAKFRYAVFGSRRRPVPRRTDGIRHKNSGPPPSVWGTLARYTAPRRVERAYVAQTAGKYFRSKIPGARRYRHGWRG